MGNEKEISRNEKKERKDIKLGRMVFPKEKQNTTPLNTKSAGDSEEKEEEGDSKEHNEIERLCFWGEKRPTGYSPQKSCPGRPGVKASAVKKYWDRKRRGVM